MELQELYETGLLQKEETPSEEQLSPRFAIRCATCLSVGFTELAFDSKWSCGICGGRVELMGKVVKAKLEKELYRAACDARCTHARGPKCDCKCHCKNHGSGKTVKVVIVEDLPTIEFLSDEEALQRASEFRTEFALKTEKMSLTEDFYLKLRMSKFLDKAANSRQHAARMRALNNV